MVALCRPTRGGRKPQRVAEIHRGPPFINIYVIVLKCTHDHVIKTVIVHIPGRCNRKPKFSVVLVAVSGPVSISRYAEYPAATAIKPCCRTVIYKGRSFVSMPIVVIMCTHDHVIVTVVVHIPSRRYGDTEERLLLVAPCLPVSICRSAAWPCAIVKPCCRSVIHKDRSFEILSVVVLLCTHDHVIESVVVHIASCRYGCTEPGVNLVALCRPIRAY